jgi:4-amino-4-deoxy-L-arabinose transferase-like glycosyltransferase
MVLADVFVASAAALTLLASLRAVERPTWLRGAVLGLAMAACVLSKIPGLLLWATPLLTVVAVVPRRPGVPRVLATAFGVATALSALPVWYFFANSAQVQEQAATGDVGGPLAVASPNLATLAEWLWAYWTPGVVAVFAVVVVVSVAQRRREELLLAATALWPPLAFALLSRSWFPRYVFPSTIPALILTALALSRLTVQARGLRRGWLLLLGAGAALLVPALRFDLALLTRPDLAPFPAVDRFQYLEGWTAGYGRVETAGALAEALRQSPEGILVGVGGENRHAWRPLHLLLRARFMNEPRVELEVLDPSDPEARAALARRAGPRQSYVAVGVDGDGALLAARPLLVDRRLDGSAATVLYRLPLEAPPN